jgi:tetratricopeptide (TPR) repeat protein
VFPKFKLPAGALILGVAIAPMLPGCLDVPSRQILNRGYSELSAQQYDPADADANEFLRAHPDGSGVAEAWYLKGRIAEAKALDDTASPTPEDKHEWLERAKEAYVQGLQSGGPTNVRAQLHTGVANVDFHEDDYNGAVREWLASYENIPGEDTKAWVLYQIGRSQQRLGEFDQADKSFARLQRDFPASEAAARSQSRVGINAFHVEVKKYGDLAIAEKAANDLRSKGFPASRIVDAGWQIVQIGPLPTFADARAVQNSLSKEFPKEYPNSVISP